MSPWAALAAFLVLLLAMRLLSRPHTVLSVSNGRITVLRGRPPQALLSDLREIAARSRHTSGRIEISGAGSRLSLNVRPEGARDEALLQRISNVVALHRNQIR